MKTLLLAFAVLALGGCVKVDKSVPKDLPSYVTVYPGAQPEVSVDMGAMSSFAFRVAASPDDVLSFYRAQAASTGLQETAPPASANAPADQKQAMFRDPSGQRILVVVARPQSGMTTVSLTYNKPKASS